MKNRGPLTTSPILPGALRLAVASVAATVACSGSLGGLGGATDDAGASASGSESSATSAGVNGSGSPAVVTSSSPGGSVVGPAGGSSSSGSTSNAGSGASGNAQSSTSSSSGASSSSPGASSSSSSSASDVPDASASPDARADGGDAAATSFAADVYPIIAARCIACHAPMGDGVTIGHLDMTSGGATGAYAQLVNVPAMGTAAGTSGVTCAASGLVRVVPGSHLTSLLYGKVESKITGDPAPCGDPMPEPDTQPNPAAPLTTAEVATIASWIDEGAKP